MFFNKFSGMIEVQKYQKSLLVFLVLATRAVQ